MYCEIMRFYWFIVGYLFYLLNNERCFGRQRWGKRTIASGRFSLRRRDGELRAPVCSLCISMAATQREQGRSAGEKCQIFKFSSYIVEIGH